MGESNQHDSLFSRHQQLWQAQADEVLRAADERGETEGHRVLVQARVEANGRLVQLRRGRQAFGGDTQIIYRHFATLYFIVIYDKAESELGILDLIQVYVETLDKSFENVCELDIIFNQQKAGLILDEMITGGLVLETSSQAIVAKYKELERSMKQQDKEVAQGGFKSSPRF